MAFLIDVKVKFLRIKVYGTRLEPFFAKFFGKTVKRANLPAKLVLEAFLAGIGRRLPRSVNDTIVFQYLLRLLIGVTAVRADNSVHNPIAFYITLVVNIKHYAIRQLVLIRT